MSETINYHLPLQSPGQANRAALNQAFAQLDMLLHVRDSQFTLMSQAVASTNAAMPRVVTFGPFTAAEGQTVFVLGVDVPPDAVVVVSRDHLLHVNGQGFVVSSGTLTFEQPSLDGEVVTGFIFIASELSIMPPPSPDGSITETPAGVINSTNGNDGNGIFTLAYPIQPDTIPVVKISGFLILPPYTDYTWTGNTITFAAGEYPVVGETLTVTYLPVI